MGSKREAGGSERLVRGLEGQSGGLESQSGGVEGYGAKKRRNEEMVHKLLCARFYGLYACDLRLLGTDRNGIIPSRI